MKALLGVGIVPEGIFANGKIHVIYVPSYNISFLCRSHYLSGTTSDLNKGYSIKRDLTFFPWK